VRCASLLEKAAWSPSGKGELPKIGAYEWGQEEEAVILAISRFRSVLELCTRDNEPHHLTSYLIDLAKAFSRFYYRFPVMQATDPQLREMRLNLVAGTRQVLANGLKLLGIACPSEM
jgi:arginyl-tRNA synthetase